MFKHCVPDDGKRAFIKYFDGLPADQKPPLVTYMGRPMKISGKGLPKLDKEAVKKAKADDIAANGHKKKVRAKRQVPPGPDFYNSREWKELRYKALQKHGARCMCCGATPQDGAVMHVDHIKPRSRFPDLELEFTNCQILCAACNLGKSNKDRTDWRGVWREKATPLDDEYRRIMGM
ncbi:HNH endonuclease [Azospirillum himalayense]|uniref:HNH endonuclease n=1 Tax=Azospirillum himalayense TaxID=654847 RepID=A0ABW0G0E9_9PROT